MTINQRKYFPKDKKALEMLNPWRISGVTKKEYEHWVRQEPPTTPKEHDISWYLWSIYFLIT